MCNKNFINLTPGIMQLYKLILWILYTSSNSLPCIEVAGFVFFNHCLHLSTGHHLFPSMILQIFSFSQFLIFSFSLFSFPFPSSYHRKLFSVRSSPVVVEVRWDHQKTPENGKFVRKNFPRNFPSQTCQSINFPTSTPRFTPKLKA